VPRGRRARANGVPRRGEAAEQGERFGGPGARVGGVGEDRQVGVEDDIEAFVVELQVADLGVVETLDAADVEAEVVAGPELAEGLAAGGQLADEVGEVADRRSVVAAQRPPR
jgi:hypothetical protein